jgi:hypothetical protein
MSYKRVTVAVRSKGVAYVVDGNCSIEPVFMDEFSNRQRPSYTLCCSHLPDQGVQSQ